VTLYAKCKRYYGANPTVPIINLGFYIGSVEYWSSNINVDSDSYTDYSNTWTTNPATGSAWTESAIDNMEVTLKGTSNRKRVGSLYYYTVIYCTQYWMTVDYTVGGELKNMTFTLTATVSHNTQTASLKERRQITTITAKADAQTTTQKELLVQVRTFLNAETVFHSSLTIVLKEKLFNVFNVHGISDFASTVKSLLFSITETAVHNGIAKFLKELCFAVTETVNHLSFADSLKALWQLIIETINHASFANQQKSIIITLTETTYTNTWIMKFKEMLFKSLTYLIVEIQHTTATATLIAETIAGYNMFHFLLLLLVFSVLVFLAKRPKKQSKPN